VESDFVGRGVAVMIRSAEHAASRSARKGFTLLEASIAIVLLSVLLGVALAALRPHNTERLRACSDLLNADLRLAQSLAMRDATDVTLSLTDTGWKIEHTGSGLAPALPVPLIGGTGSGYEIDVTSIVGCSVESRCRLMPTKEAVTGVTFTSTGRTRAVESSEFWLTIGTGDYEQSMSLTVAPYSGQTSAGSLIGGPPPT
jgi:prepilin-type N-terminal cleavage/methylation domain-containing protein